MAWSRDEADALANSRGGLDGFGEASIEHGLHRIAKDAALQLHEFVVRVSFDRAPELEILLVHQIRGIGKGRDNVARCARPARLAVGETRQVVENGLTITGNGGPET